MDKIKILLVEDEAVTAMDIKSNLIQLGYEVVAVIAKGEEAVVRTSELLPDLILMDITLAGEMTGVQAAAAIKQLHHIPIIYLTAHTDKETLDRAKLTEPFGYLPKPCNINTLNTTIEMALYKSAADNESRKTEAALKRLAVEQKIILDNLGNGVLFLKHRKIIWANPSIMKVFGYSPTEILGKNTEILYPERETYQDTGELAYASLARGEIHSSQVQMKRKDDSLIWCKLTGQAVNPQDLEQGSIWILEDITERLLAEEALLRSEERYRTVADFTYDWEFWLGPDGDILYCSPSCERVTGYPATAFANAPSLIRRIVHPDDLALYDQHRHDTNTDQEICSNLEYRIITATGDSRWIAHVCQPVFDDLGKFLGTRGSNRDISERKGLQAEIAKTKNLEALGVLAGGIAHDFNNLFQGLLGNISLAQMYTAESSEAYQFLKKAEEVYVSAAKLTAQLIAFSSSGMSSRITLSPSEYIRDIIKSDLSDSNVTTDFDIPDNLSPINVDPTQFRQVLTHMVTNALDAMPPGGKLKVLTTNETIDASAAKTKFLTPGNYLRITIEDNGSGISKENLPRIFDPYFSTKERCSQKGMGLGLSVCNTIIQKHGGTISVESEIGTGSTFHIYLPAFVKTHEALQPPQKKGGDGPRILIMDDDQSVVQVATRFLQAFGYRVSSTANGNATFEAYKQAITVGDPYALVILDLIIPHGIGGLETLALLKTIDPEVKAIISSGYTNDPAITDFAAHGFVAAFEKPYQLNAMKEMLKRLM